MRACAWPVKMESPHDFASVGQGVVGGQCHGETLQCARGCQVKPCHNVDHPTHAAWRQEKPHPPLLGAYPWLCQHAGTLSFTQETPHPTHQIIIPHPLSLSSPHSARRSINSCVSSMQGIKNALKGVQYSNPQLGERLYEICRKATSRHIDRPDEILNQQVRGEAAQSCFAMSCSCSCGAERAWAAVVCQQRRVRRSST